MSETPRNGLLFANEDDLLLAVPSFPEEGRQPASDHAAAAEALQKPNHPGLQDAGGGSHQHGGGEILCRLFVDPTGKHNDHGLLPHAAGMHYSFHINQATLRQVLSGL